ncbi:uncharacterized protein LOC110431760 [Sorghum bicolor]|uniref:Transmembrane protein n=1 Tax=Sorghum bicolor TaxID=4558 RepID=A0A1B6QR19_SORBI|nr:uncharacterized protein LOC110431760 [Sorghum bicolor]KXG40366.1 hypothetical protein SORBI_3001G534900 [Sorghum bicolor]|eukprot:XP_021306974.1 uncharacterized protein LOC110431760 [Sorghum bicolor]
MSDPSVDPEKDITGLKEEDDVQFKHSKVKVMCIKVLLHMYPVVFLAATIVAVVSMERKYHTWYSRLMSLILSLGAIFLFWRFREIKEENIERMLGRPGGNLNTTLLASTPMGSNNKK